MWLLSFIIIFSVLGGGAHLLGKVHACRLMAEADARRADNVIEAYDPLEEEFQKLERAVQVREFAKQGYQKVEGGIVFPGNDTFDRRRRALQDMADVRVITMDDMNTAMKQAYRASYNSSPAFLNQMMDTRALHGVEAFGNAYMQGRSQQQANLDMERQMQDAQMNALQYRHKKTAQASVQMDMMQWM